ncbi:MAG: hypothetical protein M3326_12035 [Actinomycetota bacterium]|nr:hypothetical protein [Actinomycetota bacterium]
MRNKIIALGVSAVSAAAVAFGTVGPATAAETPPGSIVSLFCGQLPDQVTTLSGQAASAAAAAGAANTNLLGKQAAVTTASTDLAAAIVSYIQTINSGGNVDAAGQVANAKLAVWVDKLIAENNAMNSFFDATRNAYMSGVSASYLSSVLAGLSCPA